MALSERGSLSYVDLMNLVEAANTGKFNYHLKILGDLIEKNRDGKYVLTEKGQLTVQFLQKFPQKESQQTPLHMADAVLIGFVGCVLTVANPGFWSAFLAALLNWNLTVPFFVALGFVDFVFALIVPGSVMWLLTVRRSHSHDAYDLFKPPFVALILLLLLLILLVFARVSLTVTITSPMTQSPNGGTYSVMQTSLATILFLGLVLSFLGVLIAEFASKTRKRVMS
jgi:hypothetical protein